MSTTTTRKHKTSTKPRSFAVVGPELPQYPPRPPTVPVQAHDPAVKPTRYAVTDPTGSLASKNECRVFISLYSEHREFVRRTVERHGVPSRDADDITQEVFSIALARIQDFDAAREARPWLFVIAIQRAANYRRLARHRVEPLSPVTPPDPPSTTTDAESTVIASEEHHLIRELIGRLSPKLRSMLVMHDLEERPMDEIAAELKIPLKTAQSRLKLARDEVLRRGQALALSQNALPLRNRDLLRVREELLSYRKTPPVPTTPGTVPQTRGPAATLTYLVFAA
jgi:RNA polymerase sigma factor (sigma-70 family)